MQDNKSNGNQKNPLLEKGSPSDIESEKSILGAILLNNNLVYQAVELLGEGSDFYSQKNKIIFSKILTLAQNGSPIDNLTLRNELKKSNEFECIGGLTYLGELIDLVPRTDTIKPYCEIIKRKSKSRRLISIANDLITQCCEETYDIEVIIDRAESNIYGLTEESRGNSVRHVATIGAKLADFYEAKCEDDKKIIGLPTGYDCLDKRISGLPMGMTVLAGRTGHGKTSVALNIACNLANSGASIYYCSPESSGEQLVQRILASESRVDSTRMREGRMDREEWHRLVDTLNRLAATRFVIDDEVGTTPESLMNKLRHYKTTNGLDLLIVDYIQLMARRMVDGKKFNSLRSAVQHVSAYLVQISRSLSIPVIVLAQLGREVDARPGHRPQLSDLQESSAIEQDADLIMFLLREYKYDPRPDNEALLKIIFGKFRDGSTDPDLDMAFIEKYTRMETLQR